MHAIKAKKYPIDLFALKGQEMYCSGTIDLTTLNYRKFRDL